MCINLYRYIHILSFMYLNVNEYPQCTAYMPTRFTNTRTHRLQVYNMRAYIGVLLIYLYTQTSYSILMNCLALRGFWSSAREQMVPTRDGFDADRCTYILYCWETRSGKKIRRCSHRLYTLGKYRCHICIGNGRNTLQVIEYYYTASVYNAVVKKDDVYII